MRTVRLCSGDWLRDCTYLIYRATTGRYTGHNDILCERGSFNDVD